MQILKKNREKQKEHNFYKIMSKKFNSTCKRNPIYLKIQEI